MAHKSQLFTSLPNFIFSDVTKIMQICQVCCKSKPALGVIPEDKTLSPEDVLIFDAFAIDDDDDDYDDDGDDNNNFNNMHFCQSIFSSW